MTLYRSYLQILVPLGFFGLPLALGNSLAQPLAMVLLLPFLYFARSGLKLGLPFLLFILATSLIQASGSEGDYSIYQLIRSGLPFAFFVVLLLGHKKAIEDISEKLAGRNESASGAVDKVIWFFVIGQLLQVTLFEAGIDLTNAASKSMESGRILLFPTTGTILLFFYACFTRKFLLMSVIAITLLASGSKGVLVATLATAIVALIALSSFKKAAYLSVLAGVATVIALSINPLVIERFYGFMVVQEGNDLTRQYEISHAKAAFLASGDTIVFGNGLAVPLTPGVPTPDDRWFQNSKYDIENGYWGLISKLGVLGTLLFILSFLSLPRNYVSVAVIAILAIFSFKTSYQYFTTFDGCYLLVWSMMINYLMRDRLRGAKPKSRAAVAGLE